MTTYYNIDQPTSVAGNAGVLGGSGDNSYSAASYGTGVFGEAGKQVAGSHGNEIATHHNSQGCQSGGKSRRHRRHRRHGGKSRKTRKSGRKTRRRHHRRH